MLNELLILLSFAEDLLWGYLAVPAIILLGLLLTWQSGAIQIRNFSKIIRNFFYFLSFKQEGAQGVAPIKVFFASVGGCIGVGNVVGICTAVQIGGPGALFWIWMTTIVGMTVKYAEVYLGLKYRVLDQKGKYHGGPMYFLQKVAKSRKLPIFAAILLCIYGVEVYQFNIVVNSLAYNLTVSPLWMCLMLLGLVLFAASGGVQRVGSISSAIIPFFVITYASMGLWVLWSHWQILPELMQTVFYSAFSGHAAVGGFLGSSIMATVSHGVKRSCYTTDVGIGYASVIHSETANQSMERQAALVIFDMFIDTFIICTTSVFLILVTDVWHVPENTALLIQSALAMHFPYMHLFIPIFLLLLGYNTINAYFIVGLKCAEYLSPARGRRVYFFYAATMLFAFSFLETIFAQTVMTLAGGMLLLLNCYGIFCLRKEISFDWEEESAAELETQLVP